DHSPRADRARGHHCHLPGGAPSDYQAALRGGGRTAGDVVAGVDKMGSGLVPGDLQLLRDDLWNGRGGPHSAVVDIPVLGGNPVGRFVRIINRSIPLPAGLDALAAWLRDLRSLALSWALRCGAY